MSEYGPCQVDGCPATGRFQASFDDPLQDDLQICHDCGAALAAANGVDVRPISR